MMKLIVANAYKNEMSAREIRLQPLITWLHFLNFITIAILCLALLKIYKIFMLLYKWLFPSKEVPKCPVILDAESNNLRNVYSRRGFSFKLKFWLLLLERWALLLFLRQFFQFCLRIHLFVFFAITNLETPTKVVSPKNDIIQEIVHQLSQTFNSEVRLYQDFNFNTSELPELRKQQKSQLIYSQIPVNSRETVLKLKTYVQETFGFVDILVISQNENPQRTSSSDDFLNNLNRELLAQFWTVMAFLPEMLRKNRGYILSIALSRTSLSNTGIMRSIYEELLQCDTNVKLTLVESNSALDKSYMPSLSSDVLASLIVRSMWDSSSVVKVPSLPFYLIMLPVLLVRLLLKPVIKMKNITSVKSSKSEMYWIQRAWTAIAFKRLKLLNLKIFIRLSRSIKLNHFSSHKTTSMI